MPGEREAAADDVGVGSVGEVVGREEELGRIEAFVASPAPAVLVVEGEAGIGKTTLWREGVRALDGAGLRVLRTTASVSESTVSLATLIDLIEPVYRLVRSELPAPQRRALDIALALESGPEEDARDRVLRAATVGVLRALSDSGPLALAIDDLQWVDSESAAALSFALRRIRTEPVACLFALRLDTESAFGTSELGDLSIERLRVGPLSLGATQRLLLDQLGVRYPRRVVHRLVETSGGNPFYALELARGLERAGGPVGDEPPALSQTLDALVGARIDGVSDSGSRLLALLSLLPDASVELLGDLGALGSLDEVVAARIARTERGIVRFDHPLLAAGAYARLLPEERRRLHGELASALRDPVERARHLARSTITSSEDVGSELAAAANVAASRGTPAVAAELAGAAARVMPSEDRAAGRTRRLLEAGFLVQAGSREEAAGLLDEILPDLHSDERARARCLRGRVETDIDVQRGFLLAALRETDDPATVVEANSLLVRNFLYSGEIDRALQAARAAEAQARRTDDRRRLAASTTTRGLMEIWGTGEADEEVLERARAFVASGEDLPSDTYSNPYTLIGARALYRYEVDEAREAYLAAVAAAEVAGDVDSVGTFSWGLAQLEVRAGRFEAAREYAERLRASSEGFDRRSLPLSWIDGVLAGYRGNVDEARAALDETLARAEAGQNWFFVAYARAALGFLELTRGGAAAAVEVLEPVASMPFVVHGDPGQTGVLPLFAEALAATGALDRARTVVDRLAERGEELRHTWCLASAARCRGLLLAEERDLDGAVAALREARALYERLPAPFESARTNLALGSIERRARRRRSAREALEDAASSFRELGTPLWEELARAELARVGGRAPFRGELTPNEQRIARLVAEGKTNKEVAAALFVTDRTVESTLTQIYRKLNVRSRTELALKLATRA